ncbi:MAG: hypothetical protein ABIH03_09555 [Pseudomonadota bacterium]
MNSDDRVLELSDFVSAFGEANVAFPVGAVGAPVACAVLGHWLYVRKCENPDPAPIVLPGKLTEHCMWVEVLAKGARVGKRRECSRDQLKRLGVPRRMVDAYQVGDIVYCPNQHPLIMKSGLKNSEYLIDETVPICKCEGVAA